MQNSTAIKTTIINYLSPRAPLWKAYAEIQKGNEIKAMHILEKSYRTTFSSAAFPPPIGQAGFTDEALFAAIDDLLIAGQITKLQAVAVLIEYSVEAEDKPDIRIHPDEADHLRELYDIDSTYATASEHCDSFVREWFSQRTANLSAFSSTDA